MDRYTTNLSATFRVVNRQEVNYTWMCVIIGFSVFGLPTAADHNQDHSTSKSRNLKGLYPTRKHVWLPMFMMIHTGVVQSILYKTG